MAASVNYQMDMDQGASDVVDDGILSAFHIIYNYALGPGTLTGKALYARWDISTTIQDAATQDGWYVEPSYRMPTYFGDVGVYARYESLDYFKKTQQRFGRWETGLNYWPHENVVLKFDYFWKRPTDGSANQKGFDLGMGYQF